MGAGRGKAKRVSAATATATRVYRLIGADGREYESQQPGALGGHRRLKIYGRLDCPSALRWIAKGEYVRHRVFFASAEDAISAGYRPCGVCLREEYAVWKKARSADTAIQ